MARLNSFTVNISLPTIAQFFHVDIGEASKIITFYLLHHGYPLALRQTGRQDRSQEDLHYRLYCFCVRLLSLRSLEECRYAGCISLHTGTWRFHAPCNKLCHHFPVYPFRSPRMGLRHYVHKFRFGSCNRRPPWRDHHRLSLVTLDLSDKCPIWHYCNFYGHSEHTR